ncbi:[protein-PII] uridylyltransferase [soil metagenome]
MPQHLDKVKAHAEETLRGTRSKIRNQSDLIKLYKRFLKIEEHRIKLLHRAGAGGIEIGRKRSDLLDVVLQNLFTEALDSSGNGTSTPITLVATGGYGRAILNPGSDIDLLFLTPHSGSKLDKDTEELIGEILRMLWDVGFKVGHATRSIKEAVHYGNKDNKTKSSLIEARLITGDPAFFAEFQATFRKGCIDGKENSYLELRRIDLRARYAKHSNTVYLQEPHVKNGCGGLRDYHNIIWITYVKLGTTDISKLVEEKIFTVAAYRDVQRAYDFLNRVRNDLHYSERRATDILTLRLQGVIATNFAYPQRTILRRCEEFMRDYYRHTRNLSQRLTSLMERFEIERAEDKTIASVVSFLALRKDKVERFDGFYSKGGYIYPENSKVFEEDSSRLMRLFLHVQQRHLRASPQIRQLVKKNWSRIDRPFRYRKTVRNTFETILSRKGEVARILRLMHRTGVLGRYLPEFGALTCLVQHEFFHRYTADEHTLTVIDKLDELSDTTDPKLAFFQRLSQTREDPFVLYLTILMHDTGRASNAAQHADASATLASRACKRLGVSLDRRRLLIFLVDHHLTMWRYATTKNLQDPNVIAEFGTIVRNTYYLESLFLLTYVDSKGTNEDAWSDWKESLMRQLYHSTILYLEDKGAFATQARPPSKPLRKAVAEKLPPDFALEIDAHFDNMPDHYFRLRPPESIARHIRSFRAFFESFRTDDALLTPTMRWIDQPERGCTELHVCSWDRSALVAMITGALAAHRINILAADLFVRHDDVALDSFSICTTDFSPVTDPAVRSAVHETVAAAFANPDFDFSARIAKAAAGLDERGDVYFPTRVYITNDANPDYTVVEIQALDRLGLLHDVFRTLANHGCDASFARINTEKGGAFDTVYFTVGERRKMTSKADIAKLGKALEVVVAAPRKSAP